PSRSSAARGLRARRRLAGPDPPRRNAIESSAHPAGPPRYRARPMDERTTRFRIAALLALALAGFFAFFRLGSFGLANNNEGFYASIAQGMVESGDLVVPRIDGVEYMEKPPLLYWLAAGSLRVFGSSEASARAVSAAAFLGSVLAVVGFAWKLG